MPQLRTKLSSDECSQRLRQQVQRRTVWSRFNIFRPATSRVVGDVSSDAFSLSSSADRFSKRLVGRFVPEPDSTLIDYTWQAPVTHHVYGDSRFDETEILSSLTDWLDADQV
jgi:hypothetical protein